jgi:hypothetical protein
MSQRKRALLGNGSINNSAATDTQDTIEELLGTKFSIRLVQTGYKEEFS